MKKSNLLALALFLLVFLSGCEVVGGIFKAGVWVGVIIVAVIIGLIAYFSRGSNKE